MSAEPFSSTATQSVLEGHDTEYTDGELDDRPLGSTRTGVDQVAPAWTGLVALPHPDMKIMATAAPIAPTRIFVVSRGPLEAQRRTTSINPSPWSVGTVWPGELGESFEGTPRDDPRFGKRGIGASPLVADYRERGDEFIGDLA